MCLVRVSSASAAVMSLLIAKLELHLEFAKADVAIPPAGLQVLAKPNTVFRNEQLLSKPLLFCHSHKVSVHTFARVLTADTLFCAMNWIFCELQRCYSETKAPSSQV